MKILGFQWDIAWEDKPANFAAVRSLLASANAPAESLVVLPEMFATGFSMNTAAVAEPYGGETEQFLATIAGDHRLYIVGGVAMRDRQGRARNKALVFAPDGALIAYYSKMRPFSAGGETEHYLAGSGPSHFTWDENKLVPFICYDLRFPELFRQAAAQWRPELFIVIANWPAKRVKHWVRLLQARAIENQAYVLGVNRVGSDPYYEYPGRSIFVDPDGEIIADAGDKAAVITVEMDIPKLRKYREGLPFLNDLRPQQ